MAFCRVENYGSKEIKIFLYGGKKHENESFGCSQVRIDESEE